MSYAHLLNESLVLEDEVVRLMPLQLEHTAHLMTFADNQSEIFKFNSIAAIGENMKNYVSSAVANKENGTEFPFIVFDKQTGRYAGSTRFYDIQPDQKSLQLGYTWYGKEFHGTKLNKHCKFLLLSFVFETLYAERLEFRADNDNLRSIAAMKSIGCTVEGILRNHRFRLDGSRRDTIVLSILMSEWFDNVKQNLKLKL